MKDFADITIILDRSGSMESIQESVVTGLNNFIQDQKKVPGDGCWSLVQFDTPNYNGEEFPQTVFMQKNQDEVPLFEKKDFKPRGGTALVEAMCITIDNIGRRLDALPESQKPNKVLVVVMTDGLQNSWGKFKQSDLKERIQRQEFQYQWRFLYLGANQDAIAEATSYGFSPGSSSNYTANAKGVGTVLQALSAGTRSWKCDGQNEHLMPENADAPDVKVSVTVNN